MNTPRPFAESRPMSRVMLGFASALLLAIAALTVAACGSDEPEAAQTADPYQLSTGVDDALASCLAFDTATLAGMSPAFAGTVIEVAGETVAMRVDRWYAGDPGTDVVEMQAPAGLEALIGGVPFAVDQQYLVTASDGVVNYCGYSGPATPEFTAAFDEAFGS